jgi:hypothetical protein
MAVLRAARAQAPESTVGSCLRLIEGKLFERALLLSPARAEGALEDMLAAPAGGAADPPCVRFLPQALPRLPAMSSALSARRTAVGEPLRSIVALLGAYGCPGGQAAVTQPNLIALDDKIAATAGGTAGDELYTRSLRLGAAAIQPGGTAGESRHKYNSADFELHAATITGTDEESDIRSLLATGLSVVCKCLANVHVPLAHAVTNRAAVLSTALPRYTARSIISSRACELGVPAALRSPPPSHVLDGSGLGSMSALCRPLVVLRCDPCAGFKLLAELKGSLAAAQVRELLPPETIRQLHKAYSQLFSDLGYLKFNTFCLNLVDLVGLSSRCGRLLDGKVAEFVGTCLSHVSDLVKNHFSSTSNDDKITVSFMSGLGREILTEAGNAASAFVSHVDMGLIPAHSANSAPSAGPPVGGGPQPPAANRKNGRASEAAAAPAGKRARAQES